MQENHPSFQSICQYVGQLYLQSRIEIDNLISQIEKLKKEKEEALALLAQRTS